MFRALYHARHYQQSEQQINASDATTFVLPLFVTVWQVENPIICITFLACTDIRHSVTSVNGPLYSP
jgi:hypothetical protein